MHYPVHLLSIPSTVMVTNWPYLRQISNYVAEIFSNNIQVTLKKIGWFRILVAFLYVSIMFVFWGEDNTFLSERGPHSVIFTFIYSVWYQYMCLMWLI